MYLPILPQYLPKRQLYLPHIAMHFPQCSLYFPKIPLPKYFFLFFLCDNRPLYFKIFVGQRETRGQRTNVKSHCGGRASSPTLPQCQLGNCQVHLASQARLGVLGSLLVDIGLKLHSVHFAVKFSSNLTSENLTAKCTSCSFNSSPAKSKGELLFSSVGPVKLIDGH